MLVTCAIVNLPPSAARGSETAAGAVRAMAAGVSKRKRLAM